MNWRKIIGWGIVIFIAWFIVSNPTGAAHTMQNLLGGLKHAGTSVSTFLTSL